MCASDVIICDVVSDHGLSLVLGGGGGGGGGSRREPKGAEPRARRAVRVFPPPFGCFRTLEPALPYYWYIVIALLSVLLQEGVPLSLCACPGARIHTWLLCNALVLQELLL